MTRNMEMRVPRLRQEPMPTMAPSVEILPIRKPAAARMEPEVSTVGKESWRAFTMAFLGSMVVFRSRYQVEMTMA